jgi:hypothetical protein
MIEGWMILYTDNCSCRDLNHSFSAYNLVTVLTMLFHLDLKIM